MSRRSVLHRLFEWVPALAVLAITAIGSPLLAQVPGAPLPPRFPGTTPSPQVAPPGVVGQTVPPFRYTRDVAGDASPIILSADQIATWNESDQIIAVLLRGTVLVQQGIVLVHCDQAVARFNLKAHRERGMWPMDLYAEGNVHLDTSADTQDGARAVIELVTRGEIKMCSVKAKTVQQAQSDDPIYRRALAERVQAVNQPGVIQPVGMTRPSTPTQSAPVAPTTPPVRTMPVPPPAPVPLPIGPASAGVPTLPPPPPPPPPSLMPPNALPPAPSPIKPMSAAPATGNIIVRGAPPDEEGAAAEPPDLVRLAWLQPPEVPPPNNALPPVPFPPTGSPPGGPVVVTPSGPAPTTTPIAPPSKATPPQNATPAALAPGRSYSVRPRFGSDFQLRKQALANGEYAYIITGGVIVRVLGTPKIGQIDLEADRCVIFSRSKDGDTGGVRQTQGVVGDNTKIEFFLAGNVEARELDAKRGERIMRADELYYDVDRNIAIALSVKLETRQPNVPDPIVITADEILRTSANTYEFTGGYLSSSKLPSDPGLKLYFATATLEETTYPQRGLFGREIVDRTTGQPIIQTEDYVRARSVFFDLEDVPFFYLPYLAGDARDPLGPVQSISAGYNKIYGVTFGTTLNAYDLFGIQPLLGTRWRFQLDYLTARGPGAGTDFDFAGKDFFGLPSQRYDGMFKAYGIYDHGIDDLGGPRPVTFEPDAFRGQVLGRTGIYDLPHGISIQGQFAAISDRGYLESYSKPEWDDALNQDSYIYFKQQANFWAWTAEAGGHVGQEWITQTETLPRVDGWVFGLSPFEQLPLNYSAHASGGYYRLKTSNDPDFMPLSPTDVGDSTGRIDFMQTVSLPFYLGPVKVVPYGKLDLADYTNDLNGGNQGRVWGALGASASIPFTRLYPDVHSDLWNLDGINHKIVLTTNYYAAETNDSHYLLPDLDRLNDDASDQAVRDVRPFYTGFMSTAKANFITTSPLFDPQAYAMRTLYDSNPNLLDNMEVLQLDLYQRWQTKRGYPGAEHIVDWMTLDLSASVFPDSHRDNSGETLGLLSYDWTWNIGDRTAIVSSGVADPIDNGEKVFTGGAFFNRPDRTSFYLGYTQIEPLESRVVSASVNYILSPKYALTFSTAYDFGPSHAQTNTLSMTRIGTDLQVTLGFSYNSLQSNFGLVFEIVPNLAANLKRGAGLTGLAGAGGPLH